MEYPESVVEYSEGIPELDELVELYDAVHWTAYTDDPDTLRRAVEASASVHIARDAGQLVGLLRVVSDDTTIAYVQDLLVRPTHQRRGVGSALMQAFNRRYGHVRQRVLLTDDEPGQRAFYESVGFARSDAIEGGPLRAFVDLGARATDRPQ